MVAEASSPLVGILPASALGVAFHTHLTAGATSPDSRVVFFDRPDSASSAVLREVGGYRRQGEGGEPIAIRGEHLFAGDLRDAARQDRLPSYLLVTTNPDQLLGVMARLVEVLVDVGKREGIDALAQRMPVTVLAANGIYYQRVRFMFVEKLEEAMSFGHLPDLWPDRLPRIVGRLLRGVTKQTGARIGSGAATIYAPGPPGETVLAGGDGATRAATVVFMQGMGLTFRDAGAQAPTEAEFDKALLNLTSNLLGQIFAIGDDGAFTPLTVGEVMAPERQPAMRALVDAILAVGKALGVYPAEKETEATWAWVLSCHQRVAGHVPSSVQNLALQAARGQVAVQTTATEAWLLHPLVQYARSRGLEREAAYFEQLEGELVARVRLLAAAVSSG